MSVIFAWIAAVLVGLFLAGAASVGVVNVANRNPATTPVFDPVTYGTKQ
jgi:hypothetical protein